MKRLTAALAAAVITFPLTFAATAAQASSAYPTPTGLHVQVFTPTSAAMYWTGVPGAVAYHVQLEDVTTGASVLDQRIFVGEGTGKSAAAGGLTAGDVFRWRIATGGTPTMAASPWSPFQRFLTIGGTCSP